MDRAQSPLVRAQERALRARSADAPSPAGSPETSVSVMAPPSDALETGGGSPSVAGSTEALVPCTPPAAPVGGTSGGVSESSSTSESAALSSTLGAAPRSAADAPEAPRGVNSAGLGAIQLIIPSPPATSGSSEVSAPVTSAFSGTPGAAAATSGSSTSLTINSDTSDDSGPAVHSALHKSKGKRSAKPFAKSQSSPPPPKKKQRLGRPSVDLKARKTVQQAMSAATNRSGLPQSTSSPPPITSTSASSAPVSGIAVSADSDMLSFASAPSGSNLPFSPILLAHVSPALSSASTMSLPSSPVAPSGVTPGTEALVPVEVYDDGGGDGEAASESSGPLGGVHAQIYGGRRRG
ncbi:unnamed protein product [Phytophthora fragariaefolia]|uniref:Unnamed protein product n=1 Tax=Phytophthora fragariaefolia TaxID=1490495 RepID=A0A9W6WXZ6_9STRA|nr:unnamed protein product [Phytophthora fragariaefolia]